MVVEFLEKVFQAFKNKPMQMAVMGVIGIFVFGALNWIFPMYIAVGVGLAGYLSYAFQKKKRKSAK